MISTNDFQTGLTIEMDGEVYTVVEFQHVKPGKGAAFVRSRLKNVRTGAITEKTFRAGEKVSRAMIERKEMEYLYNSGEEYIFMDTESYEQIALDSQYLGIIKISQGKYASELTFLRKRLSDWSCPIPLSWKLLIPNPGLKAIQLLAEASRRHWNRACCPSSFFINKGDVLKIDTRQVLISSEFS